MAPSVAYTRASATLTSSSNPPVLRSLTSATTKRYRVVPVRSLWWWSRNGTWPSSNDENIDEGVQRHQKIMRHRFSQALRRKAMWDREENVSSWMRRNADGRAGRRWGTCRTMSSTDPRKVRLDNKHEGLSSSQEFWAKTRKDFEKFDKDFDSFKTAIDRAIENDPYAVLFGRRLQSPPSHNNSSWISWLFKSGDHDLQPSPVQPSEQSNKRKIPIEVIGKEANVGQSQQVSSQSTEATSKTVPRSTVTTEYIYDPILGRKVLQPSPQTKVNPQPVQNFLETLFSEHGASPDTSVKQSKVYGHDPKPQTRPTPLQDVKDRSDAELKKYESSRKRQYQQLRAATLGTSIDTTAVFGGKYEGASVGQKSEQSRTLRVSETVDDAPLFSGTAYASKAEEILLEPTKKALGWLEKEGFTQPIITTPISSSKRMDSTEQRLEPSLDRMTRTERQDQEQKPTPKLQPALDRVQLQQQKTASLTVRKPMNVSSEAKHDTDRTAVVTTIHKIPETDKREDIDLLRASDIRAATKTTRITKQEVEEAKVENRSQLEDAFEKIHNEQPEEAISDAKQLRADSIRLSRSIENVRKHVKRHPDGVVANTVNSIGMLNENFKDYEKPYNPARDGLLEKLDFKSDSLQNVPSIYKKQISKPVQSDSGPMQDVLDQIQVRTNLTEALRLSKIQQSEAFRESNTQIEELAKDIRQIYEAEHGPIDLSLAKNSTSNKANSDTNTAKKAELDQHQANSNDFFAEQAEFMNEVGQLAKDVKSVKEKTNQFETDVANKLLTSDEASASYRQLTKEAESYVKKIESLHTQYDIKAQQKQLHPLSIATVKPGVPRHLEIERYTQVFEPRFVQLLHDLKSVRRHLQEVDLSLHDLKRSQIVKGSQNASTKSVQTKETSLSQSKGEVKHDQLSTSTPSPYLILVYNKTTGEVDQAVMDRLPWSPNEKAEKTQPIRIMGNLNYPAAFVTHFVELEKAGYELTSGGGDMLIFQRKTQPVTQTSDKIQQSMSPAPQVLRNSIAAEEASAQPEITETIAQPKSSPPKQAAIVLDEIPVDLPSPGPAAPTAPPTTYPSKRSPKLSPKIRRQEQVFSGTLPLRTPPLKSEPQQSHPSQSKAQTNSSSTVDSTDESTLFARTTRTLRRGILGVAAFGAAAYTIGVVAEGIGAQAQVDSEGVAGPRTKVVMPVGQRAGIYSTESSRD